MAVRTPIQIGREVELLDGLLESPEICDHPIWQVHAESARHFLAYFAETQNSDALDSIWARIQETSVEPGLLMVVGWLLGEHDALPSSIIAQQIGRVGPQ